MYRVRISKEYKKQYKKLSVDDKELADLIIERLANNEKLEPRYKDHKLKGEYKDFRECHVRPDLLLIYQKQDSILVLTCMQIGSHSEVF